MVWSDPKIQKLTRQFVTVAEEVHFIYPEGDTQIARLRNDPGHQFFKRYGSAVPKEDWNHPGTKQGIYMMGPDAEYLDGGGAISGGIDGVRDRLEKALKRWQVLAKKKRYANKKVPLSSNHIPARAQSHKALFRVFHRDLPRGKKDASGRRFEESDLRGIWPHFVQWAWNTNWLGTDEVDSLVPKGKKAVDVPTSLVNLICRNAFVDNVRGQNPAWRQRDIQSAKIQMQRIKTAGNLYTIEYKGHARMDSGRQKYEPVIYGQGVWDRAKRTFLKLEIIAIGNRAGHGNFNQRNNDRGPAPMGIALVLDKPIKSKR